MAFTVQFLTINNGKFKRNQAKFLNKLSERHIEAIAKETEIVFKQKVQSSIKRANSTGNLVNNIVAERLACGWGIGNIDNLNERVPYWRHVNFGSQAIGASHSHRVSQGQFNPGVGAPSTAITGGRWEVGTGPYSFIPTQPIAPLNYIEKTVAQIPNITRKVLSQEVNL